MDCVSYGGLTPQQHSAVRADLYIVVRERSYDRKIRLTANEVVTVLTRA